MKYQQSLLDFARHIKQQASHRYFLVSQSYVSITNKKSKLAIIDKDYKVHCVLMKEKSKLKYELNTLQSTLSSTSNNMK